MGGRYVDGLCMALASSGKQCSGVADGRSGRAGVVARYLRDGRREDPSMAAVDGGGGGVVVVMGEDGCGQAWTASSSISVVPSDLKLRVGSWAGGWLEEKD